MSNVYRGFDLANLQQALNDSQSPVLAAEEKQAEVELEAIENDNVKEDTPEEIESVKQALETDAKQLEESAETIDKTVKSLSEHITELEKETGLCEKALLDQIKAERKDMQNKEKAVNLGIDADVAYSSAKTPYLDMLYEMQHKDNNDVINKPANQLFKEKKELGENTIVELKQHVNVFTMVSDKIKTVAGEVKEVAAKVGKGLSVAAGRAAHTAAAPFVAMGREVAHIAKDMKPGLDAVKEAVKTKSMKAFARGWTRVRDTGKLLHIETKNFVVGYKNIDKTIGNAIPKIKMDKAEVQKNLHVLVAEKKAEIRIKIGEKMLGKEMADKDKLKIKGQELSKIAAKVQKYETKNIENDIKRFNHNKRVIESQLDKVKSINATVYGTEKKVKKMEDLEKKLEQVNARLDSMESYHKSLSELSIDDYVKKMEKDLEVTNLSLAMSGDAPRMAIMLDPKKVPEASIKAFKDNFSHKMLTFDTKGVVTFVTASEKAAAELVDRMQRNNVTYDIVINHAGRGKFDMVRDTIENFKNRDVAEKNSDEMDKSDKATPKHNEDDMCL